MYSDEEYAEDEYSYGHHDQYSNQYDREHMVPDKVKKVMSYMQDMIADRNINELNTLYETSIPELTEQYYKTCEWPEFEEIANYVRADPVFHNLYKELYYRHLYARVPGSLHLEQRLESYWNYCELFNYIISAESPVMLELPNQWLWEIIDEFIYQFQSFSQYRAKMAKKSEAEIDTLKRNTKTWSVHSILSVLHHLVDKSNINKQLEVYNNQGNSEEIQDVAGEFGRHSLYKMLGYFSLVGLLRLHSLLGDYYQAIKVLENIELNKNSQHSKVPGCQITISYYVGFAYMMMRRYADAIRTFSNSLLYIQKTKQNFQTKSYQNDQINKQTDQMYMLLAICLVLHPQRIDESLQTTLREKQFADKMNKMQRGDIKEFESCFMSACPKFVSPVAPPFDSPEAHLEPAKLQLQVFMEEVEQQQMLPTIRSYLKLYTTMPLEKLAGFVDIKDEEFRNYLLAFKHKMQNVVWTKGTSGLEGEFQSGSEVDFYIDKNMIHIADTKVARRYGDFFIRQIHKFAELNRNLRDE
eukprot:TRINITY_DN765_c0_g1_i1.p1 TRINITY_DN765_c0_g1~~TRINITY_DN765_c0_g1_i1.p1  ORF type:complete len:525 (-),score=172.68 TRINITY_DN765_c0_g1_i1:63-1637(-)